MLARKSWIIRPLILCFIFNAVLVGAIFYMAREILSGLNKWIAPFSGVELNNIPTEVQKTFTGLNQIISQTQNYLLPVLLGLGILMTMGLVLILNLQFRSFISREQIQSDENRSPIPPSPALASDLKSEELPRVSSQVDESPSPHTAIQLLAVLQREGRLVDFLTEDLSLYSDDQIGAAVRSIHLGCRQALTEYLDLRPILDETEGGEVIVPPDFDPKAIRLTGNVVGNPPFKGTLRHHGWRAVSVRLPQAKKYSEKDWIVAPAEVEIAE